jgi:hypothetical protein
METLNRIVLDSISVGVCVCGCTCEQQIEIQFCNFCRKRLHGCEYYRTPTDQEREFYIIDRRLKRIEEALKLPTV